MRSNGITEIDKNFVIQKEDNENVLYVDVLSGAFEISGFPWFDNNKAFCRLLEGCLVNFSKGIQRLAWNTAGGMLRFRTDSSRVSLKAELLSADDLSHMPRSGSSGFDFYLGSGKDKKFVKIAMPDSGAVEFGTVVDMKTKEMREWTINFPLYNGVKKVLIGLVPGSEIEKPSPFSIQKPIVFYGPSVTQGGCASRPGNVYTHIVSRWLDANMINLGFSGSAKGEPEMAELIATLEMSLFVMDYDGNAPDADHLRNTHEKFFKIIRSDHPSLPIVIMSSPDYDSPVRKEVIYNTYKNAVNSGDRNVFFIDGKILFGDMDRDACTVDGCHPNDLGFMRMAVNVYPVIKEALKNSRE